MQALKLKAAMKNPDEFYFAMHRKKTKEGVHVLDGAESLPHDVVQVIFLAVYGARSGMLRAEAGLLGGARLSRTRTRDGAERGLECRRDPITGGIATVLSATSVVTRVCVLSSRMPIVLRTLLIPALPAVPCGAIHGAFRDPSCRTTPTRNNIQMLKTQDLGYVSMHRSADERKAAKLRESLHMLEAGPRNKHTIFFDSEKEAKG